VTEPNLRPTRPADASASRPRRTWTALVGLFVALVVVGLVQLVVDGPSPLDWLLLALSLAALAVTVTDARAVTRLEEQRGAEAASFTRILSGLSRSVSPDAILDAIVEELGRASGADHVVVVRRRPDARVLEARLVSQRAGVPETATLLPITDLEDPGPDGEAPSPARVAERIGRRVRGVYGLAEPMSVPLRVERGVIGAIVLSRRGGPWPVATRRLLDEAAAEASAALARAYSHRAAELGASTDALTGLPNRRYFDEYVSLLAKRRRAGDAVGVLMVDIDKFKALNDRYGHAVGDEVLRAVASAIVSAVREDDVPARFGGEEFVVLLRNPDPQVAVEVGERIRAAVRGLDLRRHGVSGPVSVSVGVAVADGPDEPIEELLEIADRALYRAKRAGRDRVVAA
jgi:diguanylate cyclase (GGDEF)-like protein